MCTVICPFLNHIIECHLVTSLPTIVATMLKPIAVDMRQLLVAVKPVDVAVIQTITPPHLHARPSSAPQNKRMCRNKSTSKTCVLATLGGVVPASEEGVIYLGVGSSGKHDMHYAKGEARHCQHSQSVGG